MPDHQKPRNRATVPQLAVGDRVAWHTRKERRPGTILSVDRSGEFPRYRVQLDSGAIVDVRSVSLEFMPTPAQVEAAAAKIKRRSIAAKQKSNDKYPRAEREGNPKTADVVFCRRIQEH